MSPYTLVKDMGSLIKNHLLSGISSFKYSLKLFDEDVPIRFWLLPHDI